MGKTQQPLTILLMTVEASTTRRVRRALRGEGMNLHVLGPGQSPSGSGGGLHPDALIVDIHGDGGGLPDLAAAHSQPGLENVPVIALAGAEDGEQRVRALLGGADDCLSKPQDIRALPSILRAWTQRRRKSLMRDAKAEPVSDNPFRRTFESAATGTAILESDGRFLFANHALCELLGYTEADLRGITKWQVLHPDEYAVRAELDATLRAGGGRIELEQRYVRRDGKTIWVIAYITSIRNDEGELLYEIDQFHDITKRKEAERALRASEERFRNLTESTSDWVWEIGQNGAYTYVSPRVREILGYEPDEVVGRMPLDLMPPEEAIRAGRDFLARIASGEPIKQLEKVNLRKNGARIVLETNAVPFFAADGTLAGYRGVDRDITERKWAERRTRKLEDDLAHVSRLSTMGEMAAGFAHELNQPLTAITNYAVGCLRRLNSDQANTDDLKRVLELICGQAQRAGAVIRRIRAIIKKEHSELGPIDLNAAIRDAASLLQSEAVMRRVAVQLELSEEIPAIIGDSVEIQQVIINLARNAIEAMAQIDPERRALKVRTTATDTGAVEVSVADSGPGVDPDILPQLFDTFFTTKKTGLGIGLSICRSIVQAHGGELTVETQAGATQAGAGTIFRFKLPPADVLAGAT